MVSNTDWETITCEFESNWLLHISCLVPHQNKFNENEEKRENEKIKQKKQKEKTWKIRYKQNRITRSY